MIIAKNLNNFLFTSVMYRSRLSSLVLVLEGYLPTIADKDPSEKIKLFLENMGVGKSYLLEQAEVDATNVDTNLQAALCIFSIPFVYDYMLKICNSSPPGTLSFRKLLLIFKEAFESYYSVVDTEQMKRDFNTITFQEITYLRNFLKKVVVSNYIPGRIYDAIIN